MWNGLSQWDPPKWPTSCRRHFQIPVHFVERNEILLLGFEFHRRLLSGLFPKVPFTKSQCWFRWWFGALSQFTDAYMCHQASMCHNVSCQRSTAPVTSNYSWQPLHHDRHMTLKCHEGIICITDLQGIVSTDLMALSQGGGNWCKSLIFAMWYILIMKWTTKTLLGI